MHVSIKNLDRDQVHVITLPEKNFTPQSPDFPSFQEYNDIYAH